MALLFSAVTVTAGNEEIEFTVGGIPREYDDLVGWTAYDSNLTDQTVSEIQPKENGTISLVLINGQRIGKEKSA